MYMIYATYNICHNSTDVYTYAGCFLRIDAFPCSSKLF